MSMEESSSSDINLPAGFRFHPSEEELVKYYLNSIVQGKKLVGDLIGFLNIYNYDPRELPGLAKIGDREWYFFVGRDRKHGSGGSPNRTTSNGFWKATGSDRKIESMSEPKMLWGLQKTLVFYEGRAPRGRKTDWVMNEFRLPDTCPQSKDIVLCKIYMKETSLKVLEQRAEIKEHQHTSEEMEHQHTSEELEHQVAQETEHLHTSEEMEHQVAQETGHQKTTEEMEHQVDSGRNALEATEERNKTSFNISYEDLQQHLGKKIDDVIKELGVSRSTFKRIIRSHRITRWPSNAKNKKNPSIFEKSNASKHVRGNQQETLVSSSSTPPCLDQNVLYNTDIIGSSQHHIELPKTDDVVIIKATFGDDTVKIQFCISSEMEKLIEEVARRFNLRIGSFKLKYFDEDDEWMLVACDDDLKLCIKTLTSLGKTPIRVSVQAI